MHFNSGSNQAFGGETQSTSPNRRRLGADGLPEIYREALTIPDSAEAIILKAMSAQRHVATVCRNRALLEDAEEQCKAERLQMLNEQHARRQALDEVAAASERKMAEMLEQLAVAVKERQTTLRTEGYQTFVFPNGDVYEGEWKNGSMHGRGVLKQQSLQQEAPSLSSTTTSSPAQDPSSPQGTVIAAAVASTSAVVGSSDLYEGEWFLGVKNGIGIKHYGSAKTMYSGKWVDGKRHGRGELMEPEGMYTGEFLDGHIHGLGEYVYSDGHIYKGEWVEERYEGNGTYLFPSGAKYEGAWRQGREHGRGARTHSNGDVYSGDWHHGQVHGTGMYTGMSITYDGDWQYGTISGQGICRYSDGTVYQGEWERGAFHGQGAFRDPTSGTSYDGGWCNGKRHGEGTYTSQLHTYVGEWKNDEKCGSGQMTYPGRGILRGTWMHDKPVGEGVYVGGVEGATVVRYDDAGICIAKDEREAFKRVNLAFDRSELATPSPAQTFHAAPRKPPRTQTSIK